MTWPARKSPLTCGDPWLDNPQWSKKRSRKRWRALLKRIDRKEVWE